MGWKELAYLSQFLLVLLQFIDFISIFIFSHHTSTDNIVLRHIAGAPAGTRLGKSIDVVLPRPRRYFLAENVEKYRRRSFPGPVGTSCPGISESTDVSGVREDTGHVGTFLWKV